MGEVQIVDVAQAVDDSRKLKFGRLADKRMNLTIVTAPVPASLRPA
jgi:hypothetical protein